MLTLASESLNTRNTRAVTDFLKSIAILLIINHHSRIYYPVRLFGTGGEIGNALFFLLSGYGLYLGLSSRPNTSLIEWYHRRLRRIYPSVWVILLLFWLPYAVLSHSFIAGDLLTYCGKLFYPPFWFLRAILIFYIAAYFAIRYGNECTYIVISIIVYTILYYSRHNYSIFFIESIPIKLPFYLITMMLGIFIAKRTPIPTNVPLSATIAIAALCGIYAHKVLMLHGYFGAFQFVEHILACVFVYYISIAFLAPSVMDRIASLNIIRFLGSYIGTLTLEIYVCEFSIKNKWLHVCLHNGITFPLTFLSFLIITFLMALLCKYLADMLRKRWLHGHSTTNQTHRLSESH